MALDSDAAVPTISSEVNASVTQGGSTAEQETETTPIIPVSPDAPSPDYKHPKYDAPSEKWEYRDAAPIEAAHAYAARGWGVFPVHSLCNGICSCGNPKCGSAAKHPRTKHGHKDATRDQQQIHAWWTQYPGANIGIATGSISGILVLDVDPRHGGDKSLDQLIAEHGDLPETVEQVSGGGGWHCFFRHDDGVQNSAGVVGAGLDVRGEGGYIIVAPSKTSGEYRWREGHAPGKIELAEAPAWLISLAKKPKHSDETASGPTLAFEDAINRFQTGTPYGETALGSEAEAVANTPIGSQECTLNTAAFKVGTLVGANQIDLAWACDVLIGAGMRMKNDPAKGPWTRTEVEEKVRRGLLEGIAKPRRSAPEVFAPRSAVELMAAEIPDLNWAVVGLLCQGLAILAGAPKIGKSWLALFLAVCVALGHKALGAMSVQSGAVLYLALEDTERRLQDRLKMMIGEGDVPSRFFFETHCGDLNATGVKSIRGWLSGHPDARLVVIDTLAKVTPPRDGRKNPYNEDYALIGKIKALADEFGVCILLIHHVRKAGTKDSLKSVSGSFGLTGGADTIPVLKRKRNEMSATLDVTGRDIEEAEHALQFDPVTGRWALVGGADMTFISPQRKAVLDALCGHPKGLGASEVAVALGKADAKGKSAVRQTMKRMVDDGQLERQGKVYLLPNGAGSIATVTPLMAVT